MTHAQGIVQAIPNAEIVIASDPKMNSQSAAQLREMGITRLSKESDEVINDEKVEAVLVCSSTDTHSAITRAAAINGKHVFCEKPIDSNIERIMETLDIVTASGIVFQVGFQRRFDHNFARLRERVVRGEVGDVQLVNISSRDPAPAPLEYLRASESIYIDMMVHDFDMVRFLTGNEVSEVYASGSVRIVPELEEWGDYDTATAALKCENGVLALIDNSRQAVYGYDQRANVLGSRGAVFALNDTPSNTELWSADGIVGEKPLHFFLERYHQAYAEEIRQFLRAIEGKTQPAATGYDGLMSVVIGEAATRSARENRPVLINEIVASDRLAKYRRLAQTI